MDLNVFWFLMLGALLAGYAVLDGFDLGVGALHLLLARTDQERRVFLNAIGPVWDGNEVWLVTFGGALFAAFPKAYAAAFSGFYLPFMLLLFALIFRAVAIEFRSKRGEPWWRTFWDAAFFLSSTLSAVLFGVTIGNILRGVPLSADGEISVAFLDLLTPYTLLTGVLTLALFMLHGAVYLYLKTEGDLQRRIRHWIWTGSGMLFALYALTTILTLVQFPRAAANFTRFPWAWVIVILNVASFANVPRSIYRNEGWTAFLSSAVAICCLVALFGLAEFPNLLTAIDGESHSLSIYNASSSDKTLGIMRTVVFIGLPFVMTYTILIQWVFRGKVRVERHSY
jgi:cytochrome d ubiquinol oxidase subunit II